jgi:hypothetical protein
MPFQPPISGLVQLIRALIEPERQSIGQAGRERVEFVNILFHFLTILPKRSVVKRNIGAMAPNYM